MVDASVCVDTRSVIVDIESVIVESSIVDVESTVVQSPIADIAPTVVDIDLLFADKASTVGSVPVSTLRLAVTSS